MLRDVCQKEASLDESFNPAAKPLCKLGIFQSDRSNIISRLVI